ncbi:MAG: hypothetical protein LBH75_06740 [Treponema sp.]|nr:hypothetical protein [Treponema sp.]
MSICKTAGGKAFCPVKQEVDAAFGAAEKKPFQAMPVAASGAEKKSVGDSGGFGYPCLFPRFCP